GEKRDHNNDYEDIDVFTDFYNFSLCCHQEWKENSLHAPAIPLIQSSGTGKTRTILELSSYEFLIMINCAAAHENDVSKGLMLIFKNLDHSFRKDPTKVIESIHGIKYTDSANNYLRDVDKI